MNYREDIEICVEYIEEHMKEDITMEEVANQIGYSVYHFSRVFSLCKGISVMEYIRKRRLSLAATQLFQGKKIIDIALEYGFETPSGFAKSFRKEFGYSPTQFMKRMAGYLEIKTTVEIGGYIMHPVIVKRPEFKVAGYGIKTNITGVYTEEGFIPFKQDGEKLTRHYHREQSIEQVNKLISLREKGLTISQIKELIIKYE